MTEEQRFAGVGLPIPEFAGDLGEPDAGLAAALHRHGAETGSRYDVLVALVDARLLVPVVAVLDSVAHPPAPAALEGPAPLQQEKDSHMATVTLVNPDGRRGLLAFTGTAAMARWRTDARPVAASAARVAQAALAEGADAMLLDVAGAVPFAVEGPALAALAQASAYHPAIDPEVAAAVRSVVDRVRPGATIVLGDGREHGCDLLLRASLEPVEAGRLATLLAADATLHAACPTGIAISHG